MINKIKAAYYWCKEVNQLRKMYKEPNNWRRYLLLSKPVDITKLDDVNQLMSEIAESFSKLPNIQLAWCNRLDSELNPRGEIGNFLLRIQLTNEELLKVSPFLYNRAKKMPESIGTWVGETE